MLKHSSIYLFVVGCNQLYAIFAQIVSPSHLVLNEHEKVYIQNSLYSENFSVVAAFLRRNQLQVLDFEDGSPPVVLQGDVAVPAEDLITDALEGRTTNLMTAKRLWKVGDAAPHVHYFLDSNTKPEADMVHKSVKEWVDNTCIKFTELSAGICGKKSPQAAICVMGSPSAGCWSIIGRSSRPNKAAQQMSVPSSCGVTSTIHEFGHALGLYHMQARSDRDRFISVHPENMDVDLKSKTFQADFKTHWDQASCHGRENEFDLPAPYDFMSIMHYEFAAFSDADKRPVHLTREVQYQHILMYAFDSHYYQSHYDLFIVNTAYGCVKTWTKACEKNGKKAPKCENLGYVGAKCKCICPPAFSGPSCKKKKGDLFPPMPKAHVHVQVTAPKTVTFKESQFTKQPPETHNDWFQRVQFITVAIRGKNDTNAAVFIEQDPKNISPLWGKVDFYMDGIETAETGLNSFILLWGTLKSGRVRAEYTSSFVRNEKTGTWLRSWTSELDLVSRSALSTWFGSCGPLNLVMDCGDQMSIRFYVAMKLHVSFERRADQHLAVKKCKNCDDQPPAIAAMMSAVVGKNRTLFFILLGVAALVLLLIVAGVCYACRRRRQQYDSDDSEDDDEKSKKGKDSSGSSETSSDDE